MSSRWIAGLLITSVLLACNKDEEPPLSAAEQLAKDIGLIEAYLAEKNITAQADPSGLHYVITTEGTGPKPTLDNSIVVKYTGKLFDGAIFDRTITSPRTFPLQGLIEGWQIGFQLLPAGSTATFYIPSGLAYKTSGRPPQIPPNTNLIFEVELIDVE